MKKNILLTAILVLASCFFVSNNLQAQKKLGIRAGYNIAKTYNDGDKVASALNTFYVGVFKLRPIGPGGVFQFNGGIEYVQNGYRESSNNYRKIHYLSFPIAVRMKLGPVYAQGGVNANLRVGEKLYMGGDSVLDDDNKTQLFDLPLHVGVGFEILMFTVEARYHIGFIDVNDGNKNGYLQIGAAVKL